PLQEQAEHAFALGEGVFSAASFDGESDVAADGVEELEVALVVGVFGGIVLNHEDANGGGGRFERYAEPRGGRRADEFDFAEGGQAVKFGLRDEHSVAGAKDERGAATIELLWRRRGVELIGEEREVEGVGVWIVEGHDAIFGVEDFLKRAVDAREELIEVGGLVERVDDIGNDLALGLHALQVGDIDEGEDKYAGQGFVSKIRDASFEPAPGAIIALQAVTRLGLRGRCAVARLELRAERRYFTRVKKIVDRAAA